MKQKIILCLIAIFIFIQFKRIDKTNPSVDTTINFINVVDNIPNDIKKILINSCYDCHSYETKYPWYTNIAPISWWIEHHINEGRDELNFSVWDKYSYKIKDHKLEEIVEMVEEKEMPLKSYLPMHPEAKLTDSQRKILIDWANNLRNELK